MLLVASDASALANFHQVYSGLPGDLIQLSRILPLSQLLQRWLHFLVLPAEPSAAYSLGDHDFSGAGPSANRFNLFLRLDKPEIQDLDSSSHNIRRVL